MADANIFIPAMPVPPEAYDAANEAAFRRVMMDFMIQMAAEFSRLATQTPIVLGAYYLWVDATGDLRIKSGAPTSDTDGTVVGTQS